MECPVAKFSKRLKSLTRDREIEANGKPMEFPDVGVTLTVRCASDANPLWVKRAEAVGNETRRLFNFYKDDQDQRRVKMKEFMCDVFAEILVAGWEGVLDENDQPMPFTRENVRDFLAEHDDVYAEIDRQVWDNKNFRAEHVKKVVDEAKNG